MGSCLSGSVSPDAKIAHAEAEKELKDRKKILKSQSKVLLLGSGDSGKSTVLKQMRLINQVSFTEREIESYRQLVFGNLITGMKAIVGAVREFDGALEDQNQARFDLVEHAPDLRDGQSFPIEYLQPLTELWEDRQIQMGVLRGTQLGIPDNIPYFFNNLPALFSPIYTPSDADIVRCRARTIGITETVFRMPRSLNTGPGTTTELHMIDVGGQKSERRKWIHCFQDVTAVLFLVSLSGYNQSLIEDRESNQMQDAMSIWDQITNNQWFRTTSLILFLNKEDLFQDKVPQWPIRDTFPDFEGDPLDVEAGRLYFRKRFIRLATKNGRANERSVYPHFTTATDTALLRKVMLAVADIILRENFKEAAMI